MNLDENSKEEATLSSTLFVDVYTGINDWNYRAKKAAVSELLELANEWKENPDDPDITEDGFMNKMTPLTEMLISKK